MAVALPGPRDIARDTGADEGKKGRMLRDVRTAWKGAVGAALTGERAEEACRLSRLQVGEGREKGEGRGRERGERKGEGKGVTPSRRDHLQSPDVGWPAPRPLGESGESGWSLGGN